MKKQTEYIHQYNKYTQSIWKGEKPLYQIFKTDKSGYLYDMGTNKILICNEHEYEYLKYMQENDPEKSIAWLSGKYGTDITHNTLKGIEKAISKEKILNVCLVENFGLFPSYDNIEKILLNEADGIHLEITERCNLRCGYCSYNEFYKKRRPHGQIHMDDKTIKAAITYLKKHSTNKEDIYIGFYGGEPILNNKGIRNTIKYAKEVIKNKELKYVITTNATLINDEVAEFMAKNKFITLVSIDGPKKIHDAWRKDISNNGSYDRAYNGLCKLIKAYKKQKCDISKIAINAVYAPPFSEEKIIEIEKYLCSLEIMEESFHGSISYPAEGTVPIQCLLKFNMYGRIDNSLSMWAKKSFLSTYNGSGGKHPMALHIIGKSLSRYVNRPVFKEPINNAYLNGCCIPGNRKVYITTNGDINLCEKIEDAPIIGNVFDDLNYEIIKNCYLEEYSEKSLIDCKKCAFAHICYICYVHGFNKRNVDINKKRKVCAGFKRSVIEDMSFMCSLLEINKSGLDYLYENNYK